MSLSDDVIVMNHGRIAQRGSPSEIYTRPENKFVAEFVGRSNWFSGHVVGTADQNLRQFVTDDGKQFAVPVPETRDHDAFELCIRPERVELVKDATIGSDHMAPSINQVTGRVVDRANLGSDIHVSVDVGGGNRLLVVEKFIGQETPTPGQPATIRFSADDCLLFPAVSQGDDEAAAS